jgi:hypothetical protein
MYAVLCRDKIRLFWTLKEVRGYVRAFAGEPMTVFAPIEGNESCLQAISPDELRANRATVAYAGANK